MAPGFKKFALPFIPATPEQLTNIENALDSHSKAGDFIDIGSGDGR